MHVINYDNVIDGAEGTVYAIIDGRKIGCASVKSLDAKMEKSKSEHPRLGTTSKMNRSRGWSGKGSCTLYYGTSTFVQLAEQYAKTGKDSFFEMIVTNEDPTSSIGRKTVKLKGVNFDSIVLTKIDIGAELLDEEMPFTFEDFDVLDNFNNESEDFN